MTEVRPTENAHDDFFAQDALQHHAVMDDPADSDAGRKAEPRKSGAAAIGFGLLIVAIVALLMAEAAGLWR